MSNQQNWTPTVLTKKTKTSEKDIKKNALNNPDAHGVVKTTNRGSLDGRHLHKILEEEVYEAPKMTHEMKMEIAEGMRLKEWKTQDLANAMGISVKDIQTYVSGKATPDNKILARMEQKLGHKLPRASKN